MPPGFKREELSKRYDVTTINEDIWHEYSGERTAQIITHYLPELHAPSKLLLNAGAGIYELNLSGWEEVSLDLFPGPLRNRSRAVCASVEALPFREHLFGAIVCVGEVLAYCDPARAIAEFARVLAPSGVLICDFGNSRSFRYWLRSQYGRAADMVTDSYNEAPERIWIYDPQYLLSLLNSSGFSVLARLGTHTWSGLARRVGASIPLSVAIQRRLERLPLPKARADLMTIVAVRGAGGT
jgi:SAM-dependent methyltransferase